MSREVRYAKKACLVCGAEFAPRSPNAKTCGPECSRRLKSQRASERWQALQAAKLGASRGTCVICGKDFYRKICSQTCCGPDCRAKKKALAKRMACASLHWAKPGAPGYLPLTAADAERLRRALGYESYGKATEAAMSRGQTLTQFLTIEAVAAGIDLEKEAIT